MAMSNTPHDSSRRCLLKTGALSLALATRPALLHEADATPMKRSRLILLGTAGGPTPRAARVASQRDRGRRRDYVIDCGNDVARQMAEAGLDLGAIRDVFITHQHSDHNADYDNLLLLA